MSKLLLLRPGNKISKRYPTPGGRGALHPTKKKMIWGRSRRVRRVFLLSGREFNWVLRVSRYKMWCAPYVVPGYSVILVHWCSVAVQSWCAPVVVHGYWGFYGQRRESGFITRLVVVQRAENQCKNRDEFINFIVRVSICVILSIRSMLFVTSCILFFKSHKHQYRIIHNT